MNHLIYRLFRFRANPLLLTPVSGNLQNQAYEAHRVMTENGEIVVSTETVYINTLVPE